jgi:hypothetical protein
LLSFQANGSIAELALLIAELGKTLTSQRHSRENTFTKAANAEWGYHASGGFMPSSKARTERGDFLFAVKEFGPPSMGLFITGEPRGNTTTLVGESAFFAFDLKTKNINEAEIVADFLNQHIESVSFTIFDDHPMYNAQPPKP